MSKANNNQIVGNAGLYYVCYKLSLLGWNVMPTARNARGIDILAYSHNATRTLAVQVKTLSKRSAVPLGTKLDNLFGDIFIVYQDVAKTEPKCFELTPDEVKNLCHQSGTSFWMEPKEFNQPAYFEKWDRIGSGQD